jgi:RimJ/RimL family protein N-acetyltransferase
MGGAHGTAVDDHPAPRPSRIRLEGAYAAIVPLDAAAHADALWHATSGAGNDVLWQYMPYGPFSTRTAFDAHLAALAVSGDPLYYAILDRESGLAAGHASLLRIEPKHRVIEVGGILYTPAFQRTRGATEAMYLLALYVFEELGYRRYEWKCNALNEPSRRAALRLGFSFEGIFRQHMIVKGRNRDTAWFAMLDGEWPERKHAFERWLDASNFDAGGRQRIPLAGARIPNHSAGIHK